MGANLCDRHRDVEGSLLLTKQAAKVGWEYFSCLISIVIAPPDGGVPGGSPNVTSEVLLA